MSNNHIERMAEKIAVTMNGGLWSRDYTEKQKQVWRNRVRSIWGV